MHYFIDAIKHKYAEFSGRATRSEFWYFVLFNAIFSIVASILDGIFFNFHGSYYYHGYGYGFHHGMQHSWGVIRPLYTLAVLVPGLAVAARRLQDTGRSGWFLLLALVPIVGWIILLVWYLQNSNPGLNKYGPNPKGPENGAPAAPPTPPVPPAQAA
jgi:uncharacterized membrane protein YhaH (DUF805 family)